MDNRTVAGARWAIEWLHRRAKEMKDPHAEQVLNAAAFSMGVDLKQRREASGGNYANCPMCTGRGYVVVRDMMTGEATGTPGCSNCDSTGILPWPAA